jgi:hypothetical protein
MSSSSFWSVACKNARDKPLQTLLGAAYASCGVMVNGPALLLHRILHVGLQHAV